MGSGNWCGSKKWLQAHTWGGGCGWEWLLLDSRDQNTQSVGRCSGQDPLSTWHGEFMHKNVSKLLTECLKYLAGCRIQTYPAESWSLWMDRPAPNCRKALSAHQPFCILASQDPSFLLMYHSTKEKIQQEMPNSDWWCSCGSLQFWIRTASQPRDSGLSTRVSERDTLATKN